MIPRLSETLLLRPEDLAPSHDDMEVIGVFNPGVARLGDEIIIMARVAERPKERRAGWIALPRWDLESNRAAIDWVDKDQVEPIDPRVVEMKDTGMTRLTFISHIRVLRGFGDRSIAPAEVSRFLPQFSYEEYGVEDPRITRIGNTFYVTYVAVSRHGVSTAIASTLDFKNFERLGVAFYPENKDVVLFPEKIGGDFLALHRPNPRTLFSPPEIWLARSPDLKHWGRQTPLLGGDSTWDSGRIGAGCPPVRIPEGWLEIYHGNQRVSHGVGPYAAGVLLLDADEPGKILRRAREPLLTPQADFECQGFVPDVVFPTGIVELDETFLVYYGAADTAIGVVELARSEILGALGL